ncbi:type I restriction enzyme S subunit [Chelatococcus caeni]|uniref:Type I restriction enzyme S subunit n=1 Tax=Chelatococcus caeni TaxID=1348468 RepID=A0A840BZM5_9HYPH|nr:restriction endonuclease subunit S [Chelatococcus caeni]MBB4015707.1 type I restriction enzyme S subunit [Chelatococcus caeni]
MSEMPRGWVEITLNDLCEFNPKHDPETDRSLEVNFVPMPAVDDETGTIADKSNVRPLSEVWKGYTHFSDEDVIFAKITPCMENGKIAVARDLANGMACGSTEFHVLRSKGAVEPDYLWRFLRRKSFRKLAERSMTGAVGQRRVPKQFLEATVLALPPLAEQKRIAAKLDALNAKSARARTELARIETLVSRYKQAVLSKAFSGELTREWRAAANQSDTIDAVLKFIRSSRRNSPKLARRKAASGVPQAVLPETWRWISPDELASDDPYSIGIGPFGSNLVKGDYRARGVRLVFVRDIRRENFSLENAVFISEAKADELHQHSVTGGDLLITKMGDPPGDTAIFPNEQAAAVITADCIKVRPHLELTFSKFLYWAIRSNIVKEQILEETKGVAQQKLSLDRFRQIAIPTPPIEEQHEIVRRIESAFAKIDRLAAEARRALNLVGKLDEAILAKAFRGELVPQDENDEPAEKLLERIRAERAAAPKGRRGRGRH